MVRYQPITARRSQKSQGKQKLSEQVPAIRGQHRSPKKLPRPQSHAGTKLNLWQKGNMAGAMEEYRKQEEKPSTERLSIRLIARAWNVPYETLRRRLSGKVSKVESASGRPTILSQQSEEELAETVRKMARAGFPLSRKDIREIAYAYSDAKGIKGFSESKKIAGYYWFQGFLNRFPDISTKKAENLSAARAMGMNKTQVMKWFDLYEDLVQRLDIKDSPRHIWNVDETGVMNIHKAEEAVAIVGEPAYNLTALERGETSTVLAALNAFGDIIPPMMIHKGKTVGKGWKDGAPFGAIVKASDSGWINKDLFVEFGQLFVNNLQRLGLLNGRPHLLIMDNHYSHVFNLEFLNLMKANNIHVFALPSHTTHWLQPLDRVPFGSFKRKWNEGMRLFTRKNAGRKQEKKEFFSLFTPTWQASMTVELAQAGFCATGLFPFNAKAIPEEAFAPSTITERKLDSTASNSQPNMLSNIENSCLPLRLSIEQPPVPNAAMNLQLISVTESVDIINLNEMQLPDISNSSSAKLVDTANKDNINASNSNTRLDKQHEQHVNTDIAGSTCLPTTDENAIVSIEQADLDVSFENLMPVPHRDRPQSSRPRKKPPSYELTSEENVAFIQERTKPITKKAAKEKETSKEKKQKKTVKQKVIKKKKESKKEKKQKEEDICKYCGFAYGEATDPLIDDEWIECDACRDWLHESCIEITVRGQLCADCVQTTTK